MTSEADGILSIKVGQIQVYMLVDSTDPINVELISNTDEAVLKQQIPEINSFLIKTEHQNILIDTGCNDSTIEKMKILGVEPEQVNAVFLTHLHWDHYGNLQKDNKANFPNAKIYLSANEYEHYTKIHVEQIVLDVLSLYGDNVITFKPENMDSNLIENIQAEIIPGIIPIACYGHTPDHTAYLIQNNNDKLLLAGDFLHVAPIQFSNPDFSSNFDSDRQEAVISRMQILNYAAEKKLKIGSVHLAYPGIETVLKEEAGFRLIPLNG